MAEIRQGTKNKRRKGIKDSILTEYRNTLNCSSHLRKALEPYITEKYTSRQTVRILYIEWPPECKKPFSVDAEAFYNRKRKIENITEEYLIKSDIRNQLEIFSEANYISCYFPVRPMNDGFCEVVKTICNESAENERTALKKHGLKENEQKDKKDDLKVSAELLKYIITKAKPNMIFIFGATLDNLIKYADENLWKKMHKKSSSFVLPYSYFEISIASQENSNFSYVTLLSRYFQQNKNAIGEFQYDCCRAVVKAYIESIDTIIDCMEPDVAKKRIENFLEGKTWKNPQKEELLKYFVEHKNDFQKYFLKNIRQQIAFLKECFYNLCESVDVIIKANDVRIPTPKTAKKMKKVRDAQDN